MPKITELYAFIVADTGPDDEGIPAFQNGLTLMPMVGADIARIDDLKPIAQRWANENGKPMKIYRFTGKVFAGEISPQKMDKT